jgi:two-component system sensor histidine kinase EvgS
VLVVDDYPAGILLLERQLHDLGHRVVAASDGVQGLKYWLAEDVDMVITDIRMPIMDGYALAKAIRQHEAGCSNPPSVIIGFTANLSTEERARCLAAGMSDCFLKPLTIDKLSRYIQTQVYTSPVQVNHTGAHGTVEKRAIIKTLNHLTNQDPVLVNKMLGSLKLSHRADCAQLHSLITHEDARGLTDFAHKIRGVAGLINAAEIVRNCEALEHACYNVQFTPAVNHRAKELEKVMCALSEQLNDLAV